MTPFTGAMPTAIARLATLVLLAASAAIASASELDEKMRTLEKIRGLEFRGPVRAVTIDRAELPSRLREQIGRSMPYSIDEFVEILESLLLIEPARGNAFDQLIDLYESQVLAFYDPATRTYFAMSEPPPVVNDLPGGLGGAIAEEGVVIHELMHALQDQHFDIGKRDRELRHDTDAAMAYHAVLEGEATLVMLAYLLASNGADIDAVIRQPIFDGLISSAAMAEMPVGSETPRYFAESMKFPYLAGLRFVVEAYRRGGWAEIDRVHANPPRSTREILHPAEYLDKTFRAAVWNPAPAVSGRHLTVEHLGQFHWGFLLGEPNARGWVNDRVTVAQDSMCNETVLVDSTWESEDAARRFHSAYMSLLDTRGVGFLSSVDGKRVRLAYGVDRKTMETFLR